MASRFIINARRLLGDTAGASFIEFTVVFPLVMLIVLGTVDVSLLMFSWAEGNKVTYRAARVAATNAPVATGINATTLPKTSAKPGEVCFDPATGIDNNKCKTQVTVCQPTASNGGCSNSFGFDNTAFNAILADIQKYYPSRTLDRRQLLISYETTGLGYVGRPVGSPLRVTVSLRCMTHQLYFLQPLMGWAFPALPNDCQGIPTATGIALPAFSATLPSEDLVSNGI